MSTSAIGVGVFRDSSSIRETTPSIGIASVTTTADRRTSAFSGDASPGPRTQATAATSPDRSRVWTSR